MLKAFLRQNSFLTTTAECSFKRLDMQRPRVHFKLKHFIFILKHSFMALSLITNKCPLWLYLAFYVLFSWCALFTKATLINCRIHHNFNCYINDRETPKTCLTSHKGSISHRIMPLVINSLRGRHTYTQAYRHRRQKQFRNQSRAGQTGLKSWYIFLFQNQTLVC